MASRITDSLTLVATGVQAGSASAVAMQSIKGAKWIRIKAKGDNAGNVYIGLTGVTVAGGSTNATGGWELDAGQELEVQVPRGDTANLYYICDNAGDDFMFFVFG